jgi:serine/threonine protein kinase
MNPAQPPNDNDPTVMPGQTPTGSLPTALNVITSGQNALPGGTTLGEFEITGLIGEGGFGIVYLAYDHSLQRRVALKEYMPSSLAGRGAGALVAVKSERHADTFQAGLRSFINEARLLAQFDHPSLVKVYRFWESNDTAYMVMPFYQGVTLKEALRLMKSPPDEAWLKRLLAQLLEALSVIHNEQCFHRDIAPDNILIQPDGRPLLLDFGAARRVIGNMTQVLTVILKPGYAPVEQYADVAAMKQGPWTDIYALAAVVYFSITGHAPVPSVGRMISDSLVPLSETAAGLYSAAFLKAIDLALSVKSENRPPNVVELRALLGLNEQPQHEPPALHEQTAFVASQMDGKPAASESTSENKRPMPFYISAVVVVALAAIGISIFTAPEKSVEAPLVANVRPSPSPPFPPAPPIVEKKQFDPLKALDEIFDGRDRDYAVTVSAERGQARIGKDALRFRIHSAKNGYVYLLMVGTDRSDFFLLFPNSVDQSNRIQAGEQLDLPRPEWKMVADGPPGTDHFIAIVSDRPRQFRAAGLEYIDPFSEFPLDQAARLYHSYTGPTPLFAGKAICASDLSSACSESYGATAFSIEEIEEQKTR